MSLLPLNLKWSIPTTIFVTSSMIVNAILKRKSSLHSIISRNHVYKVALTGGPCAGKSSSLAHMTATLQSEGYTVYTVPEVPTILMMGGGKYPGLDKEKELIEYETALMKMQIQMEDTFADIALSTRKPSVIFFDRGCLDIAAYVSENAWQKILSNCNQTTTSLLSRYDTAVFLVTAAIGAEKHYTVANNTVRTETLEVARDLDLKTRKCWEDHHDFNLVGNDTTFEGKVNKATSIVIERISKKYPIVRN